MRHASARTHGESDHARQLTRRGEAEAADVARRLARAGIRPDYAVISAAMRARETWGAVARACGDCEISYDESLYGASAETVLEVLRRVPHEARTVAYVGHNPAASYLAAVLSGGEGDPEALRRLIAGMAPAMAAVLELDGDWEDLDAGGARLLHVFGPEG
jgi:phosphohistidine phosphatase